ncbi:MAG TPA: DUF2380 domain-containing protein, partial [Rhizomicrobium sp.]|nr:DUF2380 domain-containing protein [Rhizomicrobium sp.]
MIREFRLSPPGRGRGLSCEANGAILNSVAFLKCSGEQWEPRDCGDLSNELSIAFGLPIDVSSKMRGLKAISNALNEGDIARAQIAAVLLSIPEPPALEKNARSKDKTIKFIRDLPWSGLIKADWDADEHPRWPAGAPDSQGGQFAPKGTDAVAPSSLANSANNYNSDNNHGEHTGEGALNDGVYRPGSDLIERNPVAGTPLAAAWPSNGPPDEAAACARFARLCVLLAPFLLSGDSPQRVPFHDHHIFPQQFRKFFEQRGIDIDQYTVTIDASTHLQGVHGSGLGGPPGQWNEAWADFITRNPNATRQQIFDFAGQLMKRFGISSS